MSSLLQEMILQGEGRKLDFKYCVSNSQKIARSLVAFANTDGGSLLLGVKDNGKIAGVDSSEELYMIDKASQFYCRPVMPFSIIRHRSGDKTVIEVFVGFRGIEPYYAPDDDGRWKVFIRYNDKNIPANRIWLETQRLKKIAGHTIVTFDRNVEMLFNYLEHKQVAGLETCIQITNMSKRMTENLLIRLIVMELIEMEITEKETLFRRKQ